MEIPFFQVPYLGNGMVIGLDAILHVIISHGLAIGGIGLVVLSEYIGVRRSSAQWDHFARSWLAVLIVITTGVGAVTGVGIWLTTSALAPRAIASLLRIFFWPWFIEWMVFTAEVITGLVYYFTWNTWTGERKRKHLLVGMVYIACAVASAVLITGILGFMLTPDGWPGNRGLASAFFNPSYLPQLISRLGIALTLGSLFTMFFLLFRRSHPVLRSEGARLFGTLALIGLAVTAPAMVWYFSVLPSSFITHWMYAVLTSKLSGHPELLWLGGIITGLAILAVGVGGIKGRIVPVRLMVIPALLFALASFAGFERIREFVRRPYLMPGYLYANQVLLSETGLFTRTGMLPHAFWHRSSDQQGVPSQGLSLFAYNCGGCHTIGGVNDIGTRVAGRTQDALFVLIGRTHEMVPFMTPFSGSDEEKSKLAWFLFQLGGRRLNPGAISRAHMGDK